MEGRGSGGVGRKEEEERPYFTGRVFLQCTTPRARTDGILECPGEGQARQCPSWRRSPGSGQALAPLPPCSPRPLPRVSSSHSLHHRRGPAWASWVFSRLWLPCEGINFLKCHSLGGLFWDRAAGRATWLRRVCSQQLKGLKTHSGGARLGPFAHQGCFEETEEIGTPKPPLTLPPKSQRNRNNFASSLR